MKYVYFLCIVFGSFAQYVDMYVDNYVDNVSILLYVLLYYYINTKICSNSPDPKQKHIFDFGKMGKNRRIMSGGYQKPEQVFCFSGSL